MQKFQFRRLIPLAALAQMFACQEPAVVPGSVDKPPVYEKSDLQKLRWVEGNWKSNTGGTGFYQAYHFPTDSTLEIVSYQFDGRDTSGTTLANLYWRNGHLYLGPNGEWVAILLDKNKLHLAPIRSDWNSILWERKSDTEWTATHTKATIIRTIKMQKQAPLAELLKAAQQAPPAGTDSGATDK